MENDNTLKIIVIIVTGVILVWLCSTLLFSIKLPVFRRREKKQKSPEPREGTPGDSQFCLVCSAKLDEGQLVKSAAFPSAKGSKDRLMFIRGCVHCLYGQRERVCPVCKKILVGKDHLISRLFERSIRRSHVHVIGCNNCRGPRPGR